MLASSRPYLVRAREGSPLISTRHGIGDAIHCDLQAAKLRGPVMTDPGRNAHLAIGRAAPKKSLSTDESEEIWEFGADAGA